MALARRSYSGSRPSGISLTEVLIALGILTIGLLGVAAIFPVGSHYMRRGEIADRGSAIAQAAFHDVLSRGMLNPEVWLMGASYTSGYVRYMGGFQRGLREEIRAQTGATALVRSQRLNGKYGYAYVLDPLGVDGSPVAPTDPWNRDQYPMVQRFPFNEPYVSATQLNWAPWRSAPGLATTAPKWPLMRITLPQAGPMSPSGVVPAPWPMTGTVASRLFTSSDDLSLDVPTQASRPSVQPWDTSVLAGTTVPLARQSRGDYSWIVTIVPPHAGARDALANDPTAYEYEVSVAVFHKRIIDNLATDAAPTERLTEAKIVSTGLSGGEMLIESDETDPFNALKTGNWVVVCGPHPLSNDEMPRFVMRWYRVLSIEGKDQRLDAEGNPTTSTSPPERRLVALRGPQWPWQPAPNLIDANHLSNNLCVAIVPNVVAVHSKAVRMEGRSPWRVQ